MGYSETMRELIKSINSNNRLNYFKSEILKILDKKEEAENRLSKSINDYFLEINKTLYGISIEKGKVGTVGEIRTWKDGKKYKKMPDGKWVRVYQERNRSAEISIARLKGKVKRAQSVDELMNIVMNNIHRFEDENGNILPIVEELKKEVDSSKGRINAGKPTAAQQIEKFKADKKAQMKEPKNVNAGRMEKITIKDFPEAFLKGGWRQEFKAVADYINEHIANANPKVVNMFKNIGKIKMTEPFSIKKLPSKTTDDGRFVISIRRNSEQPVETRLELMKGGMEENKKGYLMPVLLHEMGHMFDYNARIDKNNYHTIVENDKPFLRAIAGCRLSENQFNDISSKLKTKRQPYLDAVSELKTIVHQTELLNKSINKGKIDYEEYQESYNRCLQDYNKNLEIAEKSHSDYIQDDLFADILDAVTDGRFYDNRLGGHGSNYYYKVEEKAKEIFANYISLSICGPDKIDELRGLFPDLVNNLDRVLDQAITNLGVNNG